MGEIKNYKIDIVKRTQEILIKHYPKFEKDEREVTFLMNCLLGLIIAITEAEKYSRILFRGSIDEKFIENIPDKVGFIQAFKVEDDLTDLDLTDISVNVGHKTDLIGKDRFWLIAKMRNCIAHQNIDGINENGKWVGVRLWNMNNFQKDFEIVFTVDELKLFAIDLAEKFIKRYKK